MDSATLSRAGSMMMGQSQSMANLKPMAYNASEKRLTLELNNSSPDRFDYNTLIGTNKLRMLSHLV